MPTVKDDYDQRVVALEIDANQASTLTELRNNIMLWGDDGGKIGFQMLSEGEITEDEYQELEESLYEVKSQGLIHAPISVLEEASTNSASFTNTLKDAERNIQHVFNGSFNIVERTLGADYHDRGLEIIDEFLDKVNEVVKNNFVEIRKATLALSKDEVISLIRDETEGMRNDIRVSSAEIERLSSQMVEVMQEMKIGEGKEAMGMLMTLVKAYFKPQDVLFDVFKDVIVPRIYEAYKKKNK